MVKGEGNPSTMMIRLLGSSVPGVGLKVLGFLDVSLSWKLGVKRRRRRLWVCSCDRVPECWQGPSNREQGNAVEKKGKRIQCLH